MTKYPHHRRRASAQDNTLPLVLSVLLHAVVGLGLLFIQPSKPTTKATLQARLISQDELSELQNTLKNHSRQDHTPSPAQQQLAQYNEALAQRQAAYQAQIAQFAKQIDQHHHLAMNELVQQLQEQRQREENALQEARLAFERQDDLVATNQQQLDEARQKRDQAVAEVAQNATKGGGQTISITAADTATAAPPAGSSSPSTDDKGSIQAAVSAHIKRFWQPIGEPGTRLLATIKVDAEGNVLSVSLSGGTQLQRQSLERAIYASSPITPIIGTNYRSFSPQFVVQ